MTKEKVTKQTELARLGTVQPCRKKTKDSNFELQRQGTRWCYDKKWYHDQRKGSGQSRRMGTVDVGFRCVESMALQEYLVGTTKHLGFPWWLRW